MTTESPKDYFYKCISMYSSIMPLDSKLTYKEILYLTECCVYNYEGKDLNNVKKLSQHFYDIKFFTRKSDTSLYKYKIGVKKWAKTGKNVFELPGFLDKKEGEVLEHKILISNA